MNQYFGTYQTFETTSKNEAAALIGADNLVGDLFEIDIELEESGHRAWLVNKFGKRVGFFNEAFSRKLSVMKARGLAMKAILSFVAYTDHPDPGYYWGEMAVICYNTAYESAFEKFIGSTCEHMCDGVRVRVDLGDDGVAHIIESNGEWTPSQTEPMPKMDKGTAVMKSKRSVSEKMIEQGRKGNKGCYAISWIFLFVLAAAVVFGLRSCGVF
ncbi:MAG: hypothetical protein Q4C41_01315 [Eggerthellaceae bacterium]|nr:hypothetical protein [Eggerthellaceae bacterium]